MKKALFRYEAKGGGYKNMGDYVQSIAARQFVGEDAVLVERDHLHQYDGEPVKLIMAAWWMHYPENWPPAKNIHPLFISFHITPEKADAILTAEGVSYLKKYEPIGCRDLGTKKILEERGVKAYFSGCLTLTLGLTYKKIVGEDRISFVDPYFEIPRLSNPMHLFLSVVDVFLRFKKISRLNKKMFGFFSLKNLIKTSAFFKQYRKIFDERLLLESNYFTHSAYEPDFKSEVEKFEYADKLLREYARSKFIVTSRLHVSLPTIAMGVPTIFVMSEKIPRSPGRFEGLLEHVNKIQFKNERWQGVDEFKIPKFIDADFSFENKNSHIEIAKALENQCNNFVL